MSSWSLRAKSGMRIHYCEFSNSQFLTLFWISSWKQSKYSSGPREGRGNEFTNTIINQILVRFLFNQTPKSIKIACGGQNIQALSKMLGPFFFFFFNIWCNVQISTLYARYMHTCVEYQTKLNRCTLPTYWIPNQTLQTLQTRNSFRKMLKLDHFRGGPLKREEGFLGGAIKV